jgi:opacity protein-like surface antigen
MPLPSKPCVYRYAVVLTLLWQGHAQADSHAFYVQLNAGMVFAPTSNTRLTDDDLDNYVVNSQYDAGYAAGLAVGYQFSERFRVEMEAFYQENTLNFTLNDTAGSPVITVASERMRAAFLLNGYYDFKNTTLFTPYITAGIGANHVEFKADEVGTTGNILDVAYQVGAGVNCKITDRLSLDVKYRYFSGADPQLHRTDGSTLSLFEVGDHQVMFGVRMTF